MPSSHDLAKVDPSTIPEDKWEFEAFAPDGSGFTSICWIQRPCPEFPDGVYFRRKVNTFEHELLKQNRQQYDTDQKFSRKGSELDAKVASIPLNKFLNDFAEPLKQGDKDFTKWWLNKDENRPFRTIKGKI